MGSWLDLTQQGLSPCKKYRASWRSSAKSYQMIELVQESLFIIYYLNKIFNVLSTKLLSSASIIAS